VDYNGRVFARVQNSVTDNLALFDWQL